jgi:hypothetical protein
VFEVDAHPSQEHTYPAGLPLSRLSLDNAATNAQILATRYLIPASQLPPTISAAGKLPRMPGR